jgi:phage baseplate assembly protein V
MVNPLRDLTSRVMMMFGRGVLRGVNDANGRQQLQVELLKGELRDGVEHMQNYGFTSHPTGGDVAAASIGGNREQIIVLVVDDRRYRIPLQAGEVAMYDDQGNKIELLRDMVKVTAVQHAEVKAPTIKLIGEIELVGNVKIQGNIDSNGTVTNKGKNIGSTHQHDGVLVGSANTGAPI